ncbi:hypothetical protein DL240_04515 [Lujinxingia litoralis]|uniref:DUF2520 domain-containing protein n=1 Tax=Lujinxingia litoralis TaxID=2211119 RepID=A0A328CCR6_9DELT|nr:DUF2520 domain-containing protein [Lujinxingia litoralis]RAL25480.1 hypothetical protein DL240_04515 [Lujinxingia litoralis]
MSTSSTHALPWIIVGYGRVGQALDLLANQLGATVVATWNRTEDAARAAPGGPGQRTFGALPQPLTPHLQRPALVWITVVDDAIARITRTLAEHIAPGSILVHTSGSLASTELRPAPRGCSVASLHPLQAITEPVRAVQRFHRTFWSVEGDDLAVEHLQTLLGPVGIAPQRIAPDTKPYYHAAAVTAANLLVSLIDASIDIATRADIDPDIARTALVELAGSSLDNLSRNPPADALSGPVARGDEHTISQHREALQRLSDAPDLLQIYDLLTARARRLMQSTADTIPPDESAS